MCIFDLSSSSHDSGCLTTAHSPEFYTTVLKIPIDETLSISCYTGRGWLVVGVLFLIGNHKEMHDSTLKHYRGETFEHTSLSNNLLYQRKSSVSDHFC